MKEVKEKIEFKDISFSYDQKKEILKHINLTVEKGKTVALVGQSGSGKSTFLRLIAGIYKPDKGNVYIDGIPVYEHPYYQEHGYKGVHCPVAEEVYSHIISLPVFPRLTEEQQEEVIKVVKQVVEE